MRTCTPWATHEGDHVFKFGLELCGSQGEHDFILYTDSYLSRAWQPPSIEKKSGRRRTEDCRPGAGCFGVHGAKSVGCLRESGELTPLKSDE